MIKKILAFGASSSRASINKKLASFAAHQIDNASVNILDLNDYEMPIYSIDRENETGIPEKAITFKQHIKEADGIIISFAEHNGAYAAAFKNIFDWISRIERDTWANKPMFLMATSPGGRGGKTVLDIAMAKFKFMNDNEIQGFSLPFFNKNFDESKGIIDEELNTSFRQTLIDFNSSVLKDKAVSITQ